MIVRNKLYLFTTAVLILILGSCLSAHAQSLPLAHSEVFEPQWTNTSSLTVSLTFDNQKAIMSCRVIGKPGATGITAVAVLEREEANGSYSEVMRWDNLSTSSNILTFDKTYYISRGFMYRLTFSATVLKDGISETVSGSKSTYAN